MHAALYGFGIVVVLLLVHFSYVDFRFRYRDGFPWFWLLRPAPPLMWLARLSFIAAIIAALSAPWMGVNHNYALLVTGLMLLHLGSLIVLEVREPR